MNAVEYLRSPGDSAGQKLPWDVCARCGKPFKTDSVEERFYNPKGVAHKECEAQSPPVSDAGGQN